MRSLHRTLIGVLSLIMPAALAAQQLTPGTWTGSISPPSEQKLDVTFDIRMSGDTTKITMKGAGQELAFDDVKVAASLLVFTFSPGGGGTIRCSLALQGDKSYSGDCVDPQGGKGQIVMRPPKS
jgi:uncharacterized protein (DUF2147 family)